MALRRVMPAALAYLAVVLCCKMPAFAEEAVSLAPIEVGSGKDTVSQESLAPKQSLKGRALNLKAGGSLGETLQDELGVANATFGGNVGIPVIRGQHGGRTRVLSNGLHNHDMSALSPDHAITVEPMLAKEIVIHKGPAAIRYGGAAIGGAVEVRDGRIPQRLPTKPQTLIQTRYNHNNQERVWVAEHLWGIGDVALHVDLHSRAHRDIRIPGLAIDDAAIIQQFAVNNTRNTEGYVENSDARNYGGSAGASVFFGRGMVGFSLSKIDNNYGIPLGPSHSDGGQVVHESVVRIGMQQHRLDMQTQWQIDALGLTDVKFRYGKSDYRHDELDNNLPSTTFKNRVNEYAIDINHAAFGRLQGTLGLTSTDKAFSALGLEAFIPETSIHQHGIFLVETLDLKPLSLELGWRNERATYRPNTFNTQVGSFDFPEKNYSPQSYSAAAAFTHDSGRLVLNRWLTSRAPEVQELYALGPHLATRTYDVGDSNLDQEQMNGWDLKIQQQISSLSINASWFRYRTQDYIYQRNTGLIWDTEEALFKVKCATLDLCLPVLQYSQEDAHFKGYEAEIKVPVQWSGLKSNSSLSWFTDAVQATLASGQAVPRLAPRRTGVRLNLGWQAWDGELRYTHAQAQRNPGENETETRGYDRWDMTLSRAFTIDELRKGSIFLSIRNLTDAEVRNSTSFLRNYTPEIGRAIQIGMNLEI